MDDTFLEKIIFSIDSSFDLHQQARFLRYLDEAVVMSKVKGTVALCVGSYKGKLERSYMMDARDFDDVVRGSRFVQRQECFLHVPGDTRQPCHLEYLNGTLEFLGPMKKVSAKCLKDSWTYVETTGEYYSCL